MKKLSVMQQLKEMTAKYDYECKRAQQERDRRDNAESEYQELKKQYNQLEQTSQYAEQRKAILEAQFFKAEGHIRGMREILKPLGLVVDPQPLQICAHCQRPVNPNPIDPDSFRP